MPRSIGENLVRLMADRGVTVEELVARSGLDRRTIQGILDGRKKPHPRTLHRLAEGLDTSTDEFFLDPTQLLYRRFNRFTNPAVQEALDATPELFAHWTEADFDELYSRFGAGGCLTAEGVAAAARQTNDKRTLHEKLSLLLESSHAELTRGILEMLYRQVVMEEPASGQ